MGDDINMDEVELEASCLRFLQAAGRVPPDSAALGFALGPLVPTLRSWVLKKLTHQWRIPSGYRGSTDPEDVVSEVLCRLQGRPPTAVGLQGKAVARLHHWVNRTVQNIIIDLGRSAKRHEHTCGDHDLIADAPAEDQLQPEELVHALGSDSRVEELMSKVFPEILSAKQLALLRLSIRNLDADPRLNDTELGHELGESPENIYQLRCRYRLRLQAWWLENQDFYL